MNSNKSKTSLLNKKTQSQKSCTNTAARNQAVPNASVATTTIKPQQDQNNLQPIGQAKPPTDHHTTPCHCTGKTAQEHHSTTNDNPKHRNPQSQQPETNKQQDHNKLDPLGPLTEPERQHQTQPTAKSKLGETTEVPAAYGTDWQIICNNQVKGPGG